MPPLLELMAEVAYPASEGITANGVILLTQIACLVVPATLPSRSLPTAAAFQSWNLLVVITMALCFVLTVPVNHIGQAPPYLYSDPKITHSARVPHSCGFEF